MIALSKPSEEMAAEIPHEDPVTDLSLRLYIRQRTLEARAALSQLHAFLESTEITYELQILDVSNNRELAIEDQVPFTPLLIRRSPLPVRWIAVPQQNLDELRDEVLS